MQISSFTTSIKVFPMHHLISPKEVTQIHAHLTKTPNPTLLLNSLLQTLSPFQNPIKTLQIYNLIPSPTPSTFIHSLKACSLHPTILTPKAREIHSRLLKFGHHLDPFTQTSLLCFYSAAGDLAAAGQVFSGVSRPDVAAWTSWVSALARNGRERDSLLAFASMDVKPNAMTLVTALPACSRLKALVLGKSIHGYCLRCFDGSLRNVILDNAIVDMYMGCGAPELAFRVFERMPIRDVVSWTTIVSGFGKNGRFVEAFGAFVLMLWDGNVMPNEITLTSVLSACASMGASRLGRLVHAYLVRSCIGVDTLVGNALINMYAKCGDVGMALKVFCGLENKDLVSWCTVMGGMAVNGQAKQALQMFSLMLCHGVKPDGIAFVAVLSACCHAGLVEECAIFFKAMSEVYGIEPQKEHYTCLIDTFGRAGRLDEAVELVQGMPIDPDVHVWGALLSGWKIHGGDEWMARQVGRKVLQGEVVLGGGAYALMSNMLAQAGNWKVSNSVREQMSVRRIRKTAGHSSIEASGPEASLYKISE